MQVMGGKETKAGYKLIDLLFVEDAFDHGKSVLNQESGKANEKVTRCWGGNNT